MQKLTRTRDIQLNALRDKKIKKKILQNSTTVLRKDNYLNKQV